MRKDCIERVELATTTSGDGEFQCHVATGVAREDRFDVAARITGHARPAIFREEELHAEVL